MNFLFIKAKSKSKWIKSKSKENFKCNFIWHNYDLSRLGIPCQPVTYVVDKNFVVGVTDMDELVKFAGLIIGRVTHWCREFKWTMNIQKTDSMIFDISWITRDCPKKLDFQNTKVMINNSVKFLEVVLNRNMNCLARIEYIRKKLNSNIYTIVRLRNQVDQDILKVMYFSNFQSLLS